MKKNIVLLWMVVILAACHHHEQGHDHQHECDAHSGHRHDTEMKALFTTYSDGYEAYAECTPLVAQKPCEGVVHITTLRDFKPLSKGSVEVELEDESGEITTAMAQMHEAGIFHFQLTPSQAGTVKLRFKVTENDNLSVLTCATCVSSDEHAAYHIAEHSHVHSANAIHFTKEQAWSTDFATDYPQVVPFGQVIPVVAQVQPTQGNEVVLVAQSSGVVNYLAKDLFEGREVTKGTALMAIHSDQLLEDNLAIRLKEAQNDYETAKQNYERAQELVKEKIVSEKEFSELKNAYDNAKLVYDNLCKNIVGNGRNVVASMGGYLQQILVPNGAYVAVGQPLMVVSQTQDIVLKAEVPQRYASLLPLVADATIENPNSHEVYDLQASGGKVISYAKALAADDYLLPVVLQMKNIGSFVPGSFVQVRLKTTTSDQKMVLPKSALMEEQGYYYVFVQLSPEQFEKREVKIGVTDGKRVEVLSGITPQHRVVTRGALMVKLSKASGALDPHAGHVH